MIKTLEMRGKTEEAAVNAALAALGMDRDDVSVEILERAKSGFFGIGASPALIRVSYEAPDEPAAKTEPEEKKESAPKARRPEREEKPRREEKPQREEAPAAPAAPVDECAEYAEIRRFLGGLLERMGVKAGIEIGPREGGGVSVNLTGSGMGTIIGRRGETLDAIQHLTNYVVNHGSDKRLHISVDAESYRSKREESLTKLAEKMAEKAIKYKRGMALEPMNSYERHVIHTALQNYEGVTTSSTGVEPNRRVVVSPVKTEQTGGNKPQSREWA